MNEKTSVAVDRLEELAAELKLAVIEIRENGNQTFAYQRAYHVRTALTRVVQSLGVGVPMRYQARKPDRPVGDGTQQFERNHAAIHQAHPGECVPCDKVYGINPGAYKGELWHSA